MDRCNNVTIPEVDNSSPCDQFLPSDCVIVTRKSKKLKNIVNNDLNNYFELLDAKLSQLDNLVIQLKKEQEIIIDLINNIQNGSDPLDIGTWEPGD